MVQLYYHPFSSYCQKALIAFYEHDIAFEPRLLDPDHAQNGAEFAALWPLQHMPLLRDGERTFVEASIIVEYVDRFAKGAARLIPADADAALDVRLRDRIFDNYVMSPMQTIVFDRRRADADRDPFGVAGARARLDTSYRWLDGEMARRTWAAGDAFSLADCAAGPSLFYAHWVHPIDAGAHPHLAAYKARLESRPSFAKAIDGGRPFRHFFPGGAPVDA